MVGFLSNSLRRRHGRVKKLLRAIFFLLGVGILVPWNAFISAKHYFVSRLCENTGDAPRPALESVFSMVYNISSVLSLGSIILLSYFKHRKPTLNDTIVTGQEEGEEVHSCPVPEQEMHSFWLVVLPLAGYFMVFLGQTLLVLHVHLSVEVFWSLTLLSLTLCGICCSIANAGIVATAGLFDASVSMNPFLAGQSAGGVAVAIANFIAASMEDPSVYWKAHCNDEQTLAQKEICTVYDDRDWAVFTYFFVGSFVLLVCLVAFSMIHRMPNINNYDTVESADGDARRGYESLGSMRGVEMKVGEAYQDNTCAVEELLEVNDDLALNVDPLETPIMESSEEESNETAAVWHKVRDPAFCIFAVFFVTLALFPGWLSELRSVHRCHWRARLVNDLYTPFAFVVFNMGDLLGRLLSASLPLKRIQGLSRKLVTGSLLRLLFFPLLLLCVGGDENRFAVPSDMYSLLVQLLFAMSNGVLVTTAFVHAPRLVPAVPHVQERSSELLTFCLAIGLLSGSMLSYPVTNMMG